MGDGQARSMAWERVATQQIIRFSTSDVAAQVWQLQEQIDLLLKMSLSLKLWQGKCTRMFIAFAFQWEGLSKHSLFLDSSWCGLLERRSAQLLFKWVCNLETFLGKQVCSEEGYRLTPCCRFVFICSYIGRLSCQINVSQDLTEKYQMHQYLTRNYADFWRQSWLHCSTVRCHLQSAITVLDKNYQKNNIHITSDSSLLWANVHKIKHLVG